MYGDYCFWSWLRYWYIDSVNFVTLLLLDKGYFDYDFERSDIPTKYGSFDQTVKSEEDVQSMLAGFGFCGKKNKKPETIDEIQKHIIEQESYGS